MKATTPMIMSSVVYKWVTVVGESTFQGASLQAYIMLDGDYSQSRIYELGDHTIVIVGGTYQNASKSILRFQQSGSTPAQARLRNDYTYAPGGYIIASGTTYLDLYVKDTNYWSTYTVY